MKLSNILSYIVFVIFFFFMGVIIGKYINDFVLIHEEFNAFNMTRAIIIILFILSLALYTQIIIHELGHLIFGLLTGYKFVSFRIGNFILIKNQDGFFLKRYSLIGTGGQCLLSPPKKNHDGTYPYKLYLLGGVLLNLFTAIIFIIIYFSLAESYFTLFLLLAANIGILSAYTNGIPMNSSVGNDAQSLKLISKDKNAMDAMWKQLKINTLLSNNISLEEMPDYLYEIPENSDKHNVMISTIDIFKSSKLLLQFQFSKAYDLIKRLLSNEYTILPIYQFLLQIDKLTIELLHDKENTDISIVKDKEFKVYKRAMRKYPSIIRFDYAIKQLKYGEDVFEEYKEKILKISKTFPYNKDIEMELNLMEKIRDIHVGKQNII